MTNLRKAARGRECHIDESNERWRPVLGFEGLYEVSNFGRVRSVSRWVNIGRGAVGCVIRGETWGHVQ
ncbi:hypothetical protein CQJ27_09140 [Escherichia sp. E1130]|nr:hypothetical protein CQJ27_09140 [Escherichia sp. E1130]TLI75866.1 hypothetical protein FEK66_02625 [Escherichia sp. E1130]